MPCASFIEVTGEDARVYQKTSCEPVELDPMMRIGALLRNRAGEVMLIRRHGAKFAARVLTSHAGTRLDQGFLTLSTDDPHFGSITLDLGEQAQVWAASLRRLGASA